MGDRAGAPAARSGLAAAALGAVVPGLGHGYVGRWGRAVLVFAPALVVVGAAVLATRLSLIDLVSAAVRPTTLKVILIVNLLVVVWRLIAVVDPYRVASRPHNPWTLAAVAALCLVVAAPHVIIAKYTMEAAATLDQVFVTEGREPPAAVVSSVETPVRPPPFAPGDSAITEVADPATQVAGVRIRSMRNLIFREGLGDPDAVAHSMDYRQQRDLSVGTLIGSEAEGTDRITILLAGGDGGPGRSGQRTDTIIVATLDTTTGKAAAFGIPRNMTHVPLPSAWSTAFTDLEKRLTPWEERRAWTDEDGDGEPDQFVPCHCFPDQINAIYPFTRKWVDTYPDEPDPGLAALRDTLEIMLGIDIDYYAMIDMSGFVGLVDALGGAKVYVTSHVQVEVSPAREGEEWIEVDLAPGWHRLNGHEALAYLRERHSTSDYARMKRQRCLLKAVAARTDAATVVRRFSAISRAVARSVRTDIPRDYLPALLEHAAQLDYDDIATIGFVPPYYTPQVDARGKPIPDLRRIQAMVRWALNADTTTQFATGGESECRI